MKNEYVKQAYEYVCKYAPGETQFLNVCSKAKDFKIERLTFSLKRKPPLKGPIALLF